MTSGIILLLLLPLAAASGWYYAVRQRKTQETTTTIDPEYLRGLNYLVDDNADKAIEVFVKLLQVDNSTIETHLALGNLFRRQGEVDRALRIHQNLFARPNLEPIHRNKACYELGSDYMRAGMLDRAEGLFRELADKGIFLDKTLPGLVSIYEQERDWQQAIETSRRLEPVQGHSLRPITAQYYCEMAEDARRGGQDEQECLKLLRQALTEHPDCVRASLMEGALHEKAGRTQEAIQAYRRIIKQDSDFISEILEPLERCYSSLYERAKWREDLEQMIRAYDGAAPRIALAAALLRDGQEKAGMDYLASYLKDRPSWIGFYHLLDMASSSSAGALSGPLEGVRSTLHHLIEVSARYHCSSCGFEGRSLHWQCPRCKHWNTLSPLKDIVPMPSDHTYVRRSELKPIQRSH